MQGKAGIIMDNLIAEGKALPFIVVMTYGMTNDVVFGRPFDRNQVAEDFGKVLIDELVPYIDSHFRTVADRKHRAMAGLSMGGMETHAITLARPGVFGHWGIMSGGMYTPEEIKDKKLVDYIFISRPESRRLQRRGLRVRRHGARVPHLAPQLVSDGSEAV